MRRWTVHLWIFAVALGGLTVLAAEPRPAQPAPRAPVGVFKVQERIDSARQVVRVDRGQLRRALVQSPDRLVVPDFPVESGVELQLAPFSVVRTDTRFVVGHRGAEDVALVGFYPSQVSLLRGGVRSAAGESGSAFLAFDDHRLIGSVTVGDRRYELSSQAAGLSAGQVLISSPPDHWNPLPPGVPFCATDTTLVRAVPVERGDVPPARGRKRIELAVDSDYELFERFGNLADEAFYVTALYGAVSDIYIRDANAHIELTYVRLWDNPADLYNELDPLNAFGAEWETNMAAIPRDAAQLLTGRRNLPYGGISWVTGLCTSFGYSVAGLVNGSFDASLTAGSPQWDIIVTAHELGHNCGASHTHDYGLDDCYPHPGTEERGTLMSYCHTQNGGVANMDLRFHREIQQSVLIPFLDFSFCIDDDCNANGVADNLDLAGGTCLDANANSVPDECEDCDHDGILDPAEILAGAPDIDSDGVPDACQPDCNANGVPDTLDVDLATSLDDNGDGVPDECAADCDTDGLPDHVQIRADMRLDVNRNLVLDACEDCDADGVIDLVERAGAHDLWVVGAATNYATRYHGDTGALSLQTTGGTIQGALDILVAPGGNVLVASGANWRVIEFDGQTGAFVRNFVSTGLGGLRVPAGLAFGPDGHLYVSSRDTDAVFKYDGATGAFLSQFILPGIGGLDMPYGLTFGPQGNLFICSGGTNQVLEYDGSIGAFIRVFVAAGSGGLSAPRGLTFKADGNLLVASSGTGRVLEYARGTGAFVRVFNRAFSTLGTDISASDVAIGPRGGVFVARNEAEFVIMEYDVASGTSLSTFVRGPYSGLDGPVAIAFAPGFAQDCNVNFVLDDCEILSGALSDADTNGVPDACQVDCDANGEFDWLEIIPRGARLDCNLNGVLDDCEYAGGHPAPGACVTCSASGDFDNDGDFDLLDAYYFTQCAGADMTLRSECACANLDDYNTLIDAADWSLLEIVLTGPQ